MQGGSNGSRGLSPAPSPLTLTTGLKVTCQDRGAVGAEIETPKAVRGRDVGVAVPSPPN